MFDRAERLRGVLSRALFEAKRNSRSDFLPAISLHAHPPERNERRTHGNNHILDVSFQSVYRLRNVEGIFRIDR